MDVLRDNNRLCIVEDIELNGLQPSIEHILKWPKYLKHIHTADKVVLNVLNWQIKIKYSKCDNL